MKHSFASGPPCMSGSRRIATNFGLGEDFFKQPRNGTVSTATRERCCKEHAWPKGKNGSLAIQRHPCLYGNLSRPALPPVWNQKNASCANRRLLQLDCVGSPLLLLLLCWQRFLPRGSPIDNRLRNGPLPWRRKRLSWCHGIRAKHWT